LLSDRSESVPAWFNLLERIQQSIWTGFSQADISR
jgi:hypothetical protein